MTLVRVRGRLYRVAVNPAEKSRIQMMEGSDVTLMEPDMRSDSANAWVEVTVRKHLWKCLGRGYVWQMKHEAESCAARGHRGAYTRYCGGWIENGVHRGGAQITFRARRHEKV